MDTAVQYFIIDNSRSRFTTSKRCWREAENGVGERAGQRAREGEKSIRNRVLRANSGWEPKGEVGRWKWRINPNNLWNRREEENWESACRARVYVRTCALERVGEEGWGMYETEEK